MLVERARSIVDGINHYESTAYFFDCIEGATQRINKQLGAETAPVKIFREGQLGEKNGGYGRWPTPGESLRKRVLPDLVWAQSKICDHFVVITPHPRACSVSSVGVESRIGEPLVQSLGATAESLKTMAFVDSLRRPHGDSGLPAKCRS